MKKFFALFLCVLLAVLMSGCSLDYSNQADEGCFSFAYGDKAAFVTAYRWDGTDEAMTIVIPEEYDGRRIESVGGFFGRGLPMPFSVDISACFPEDALLDSAEVTAIDETVQLNFTLVVPKRISDVKFEESQWIVSKDGKTVEYDVSICTEYVN